MAGLAGTAVSTILRQVTTVTHLFEIKKFDTTANLPAEQTDLSQNGNRVAEMARLLALRQANATAPTPR